MNRPAFALLAVLAGGLLLGCSTEVTESETSSTSNNNNDKPTPTPSTCTAESWAGEFEVGSGESCFGSLAEGQSAALIAGPQGGFHMWVSFRCRDCEGPVPIHFGIKDPETGAWLYEGAGMQSQMTPLESVGDYRQWSGLQAMMPGDSWSGTDPEYLGSAVRVWAEMTINGQVVSDEVDVVVDHIEYWSPPCDDPQGCFG